MIKIKHVLRNGSVVVDSFPTAVTSEVEDDGVGGRILVLRDADGHLISSGELERVLDVITGETT